MRFVLLGQARNETALLYGVDGFLSKPLTGCAQSIRWPKNCHLDFGRCRETHSFWFSDIDCRPTSFHLRDSSPKRSTRRSMPHRSVRLR